MHRKISILGGLAVLAMGLMAFAGISYAQYGPGGTGITLEVERDYR